ncbi:Autophagy protein 22 [Linnemannia exigua]|uniref:Autophagy-related protein n=1 Tax=Linnemannia exigua TaxID=604196 RepID=A0AAD4H3Z2_9FUNG|nr:Autophagy protein 22 [Linnemannia exigua]
MSTDKFNLANISTTDLASREERQIQQPSVQPLKRTEVWAWYIQSSTFCGYGWISAWMLVPVLIQDMASKYGVEVSDHSIPCDTTVAGFKCVTSIFGHYVDPGAFSLYISSLGSILSFFVSLSISAVADHGSYRKSLLITFSAIGCLACLLFFTVQSPKHFWIASVLSPIGWICFNICSVFAHSFLPVYGRVHPDVLDAVARGESQNVVRKLEEQAINDISAIGFTYANIGTILIYAVCIGLTIAMHGSYMSLEIAIAFTGVWWLMWIVIVAPWLDARPGTPMPKGQNWIVYSWKKTFNTLASVRKLPEIFKFIVAWFILSDGVNTITAILFVILYRDLAFTHLSALYVSALLSITAGVGSYGFLLIRQRWKLSTMTMNMICLALYVLQLVYLVGAPYFTTNFGMRNAWEGWFFMGYNGLIISTFFGSCRVMLSELCPPGDESEWFSLYLLADKGSSWVGPFISGAIFSVTGDYRRAFWFPLVLTVLGTAILGMINMDRGKDQAQQFAREKDAASNQEH